jgi:hypothetical protein
LLASNAAVLYDSADGILVGPVSQVAMTNETGLAQISLPSSDVFTDSLKAGYDISLKFGGRLVGLWPDLWLTGDSLRLTIRD